MTIMMMPKKSAWLSLILLLALLLGIENSKVRAADETPIVIEKVETDWVKAEKLGIPRGANSQRDQQKWLLVEITFTAYPDPKQDKPGKQAKLNFLDEVQFKVIVEGREEDGSPTNTNPVLLTGDVTYMMVPTAPQGAKNFASFYIPSDVAARYHLDKYITQFDVNAQALVGGQVADSKNKKSDDKADWYAGYPTVDGKIFNKNQSPFILNDTDRYPTIKPK